MQKQLSPHRHFKFNLSMVNSIMFTKYNVHVFFDNITKINEYVQHFEDLTLHFGPDYAGTLY